MFSLISLLLVLPVVAAAEDRWQRVEDFRSDLTASDQTVALALWTRALASQAYL